jgi:transposase
VEGAGSYGAGLAGFLQARGERVVEVGRPERPARRTGAKSDALDAVRAARHALADRRRARGAAGRAGAVVAAVAPWLLELPGVGPISAAQVL